MQGEKVARWDKRQDDRVQAKPFARATEGRDSGFDEGEGEG